jgi:hypothetical protein
MADELVDDTGGWNILLDDPCCQAWEELESRLTVSYPAINRGWPSVEAVVEVSIEVHSDLKDFKGECPACRLLISIGHLSVPDLLGFL